MNTFTSCGLPWYPPPADGKCPCNPHQLVRVLLHAENKGIVAYDHDNAVEEAYIIPWSLQMYAGWYPVNPDGTELEVKSECSDRTP